ncbi:MAG: response regulator [Pirellulaceae bacterium]|nr:response regulator [Pirellulaceae bacterium]
MVSKKIHSVWRKERSQRFAALVATFVIVGSGLPVVWKIGPVDLGTALPLVIYSVFLTFLGARYTVGLCWVALATVNMPILFTTGDARWDAIRNGLFVSVGALAIAWAHRQQRMRLQQRARARRRLVGRVKSRAKQLQRTGSELRLAVQRSETAHRTLLEHLPVHVLQKDLDGRFIFVSQSFSSLLGREIDDILGKTDHDFYDEAIATKFRHDDLRVTRDGKIVDDIERTQLPDGTIAYMQVRKAPLRDVTGTIVGVQGIFWDVTEALSGRKQLQRIESWAHALIQAALDAVLIVDVEGRVLEVNPAVETILGYHQQGQEHPPLGEIMRAATNALVTTESGAIRLPDTGEETPISSEPSRTKERRAQDNASRNQGDKSSGSDSSDPVLLNRLLKQATGRRIEVRLRRPDDTWFDAEISAHPLVVENSSGWAIFIRDITRRKRSVSELQAAKEAAERANMAKSEFVANVSHELRTPLTGIVGLHELLERSHLDDQQREYIALARNSSDNLLALIDALLDFSKIEAHRLELECEEFDLLECVESAAVALAARAQLRGLELVIDCAPNLPSRVIGDRQRVRQVLLNLIGNAIKFTQRGDICVRVELDESAPTLSAADPTNAQPHPEKSDSSISDTRKSGAEVTGSAPTGSAWIRFSVIDAGIGIAEETQAVIFEAFRQADSSTTRRYGGTGLGLAICRELVHLMDGTISVASVPQQGSTFTFTLPMQVTQWGSVGPTTNDELAQTNSGSMKVALVAQSTLWQQVLARDLKTLGCEVVCMDVPQLLAREPKPLFSAGNHTVIVADYRELLNQQPSSLPVVARIVLTVPLAFARPSQTPAWLRHADYHWLQRPICRDELQRVLSDDVGDEHPSRRFELEKQPPATRAADILLVEDSPINQTVLQGILHQLGHTVTLAQNGREAIGKCASKRYDVVLMDIQMPEVDGLEATRQIRAHEQAIGAQNAYIIALTAHAMPSDREQSRAVGMNGFLVKPIPLETLRQAILAVPLLHVENADLSATGPGLAETSTASMFIKLEDLSVSPKSSEGLGSTELHAATGESTHHSTDMGTEAVHDWTIDEWPSFEDVVELLGGNTALAHEVIELLSLEAKRLVTMFAQASEAHDQKEARRAVHTLKSNFRSVGLFEAADLAGRFEVWAQASNWLAMDQHLYELEQCIDHVITWCRSVLTLKRKDSADLG